MGKNTAWALTRKWVSRGARTLPEPRMLAGSEAKALRFWSTSVSATVRSGCPARSLPTRTKKRSAGMSPVRSAKLGKRITGISAEAKPLAASR